MKNLWISAAGGHVDKAYSKLPGLWLNLRFALSHVPSLGRVAASIYVISFISLSYLLKFRLERGLKS